MKKQTIVICSSASLYRQAVDIETKLVKLGYRVVLPMTAVAMKKAGDYDLSKIKTWLADPNDYHKRTLMVKTHFKEIEKGDILLVTNFDKADKKNYIGPNVLMEMGVAFHYRKPIFILNGIPPESPFIEEILCLNPVVLNGDIGKLTAELEKQRG